MTVILLLLMLVVFPAMIGYYLYLDGIVSYGSRVGLISGQLHRFFRTGLEPGDFLVYRKAKVSSHPGPRARNVQAAENGDDYYYDVDKYWAVADVLEDGRLIAVTRTGKRLYLQPADERLRKAGWIERVRHRSRFPQL